MRLVLKYGGNGAGAQTDSALFEEIAALRVEGHDVILVHGGGPEIDAALRERGIETPRVDGLRVTKADALGVAESVLCGTVNKRLVRACVRRGVPAVGISGQDGGFVRVRRASSASGADLGYVGEIASVEPSLLTRLLAAGYLPIVAPIAVDGRGEQAYNVNADSVAGAIAAAVKAAAYVVLSNVNRVLRDPADPSSGIDAFTPDEAALFVDSPACNSGMKPKLRSAIDAVWGGAERAYICAAKPRAVSAAFNGEATLIAHEPRLWM